MPRRTRTLLARLAALFVALSALVPSPAQQPAPAAAPAADAPSSRVLLLRDSIRRRAELQAALATVQKGLSTRPEPAPEEKSRLEKEAARLVEDLKSLEATLRLEITGVRDVDTSQDAEIDLERQVRQVVRPALDFLDDLMKQPREIDELRRAIQRREREIPEIQRALEGIAATAAEVEKDREKSANAELRRELATLAPAYRRELETRRAELAALQRRLAELMAERKSFGHYAARIWSGYVLQRLLNLVLAIAAFSGVLLVLRWLHRWISRRGWRSRLGISPFLARFCDVVYYVLSGLTALGAGFIVLWASGDWLLLTLAMLLVAGLVLLSRQTLPRFYDQARLLLNLGPVREGERVLYRGLPWLVKRLHFYTELHNPSLTGGLLRLPLRDLAPLASRACSPRERWFPTEEGDWVELGDGTVGKVVLQTPEMVQIVPVGGSFKSYPTTEFLARIPRNLSHNFRLQSRFPIDYSHADLVADVIPAALESALRDAIGALMPPEHLLHVRVELAEAAASSLDLAVIADFAGAAAPHFSNLQRLLTRVCALTSFAAGWTIPFRQVVVHRARSADDAAAAE